MIVDSAEADVGLAVNATNDANVVYPVLDSLFVKPMGSVRAMNRFSSSFPSMFSKVRMINADKVSKTLSFQMIVDSGAMSHIFPFRQAFVSYCATPGGYGLLADRKKVPSLELAL